MKNKLTGYLYQLLFYLIIFLIIFIPLYPKLPVFGVSGTFVAIRLEDFVIAFTLLIWGIYLLLSRQITQLIKSLLFQLIVLFLGIGLLASFSAILVTHTATLTLTIFHFLRRVELMLLLPMVAQIIKSRRQAQAFIMALLLTAFFVCLYALGQRYLNWPVISTTNSEFSKGLILHLSPGARINSTFAGHYDLAVFLVMILSILTAVIFSFKNKYQVVLSGFIGSLSFIILVMTAARLSFIAAIVGIITSLLLTGKKLLILLTVAIILGVLVYPSQLRDRFISTITVNLLKDETTYQSRNADQEQRSKLNIPTLAVPEATKSATGFLSASNSGKIASDIAPGEPIDSTDLGVYRSFLIRINLEWPRGWRALFKNPLLGTGYSSLGLATDNDLIRSLGEVGLLGTTAFVLIMAQLIKEIYASTKNSSKFIKLLSIGIFSMIVAFLINGLFIDVLEASKVAALFWIIAGVGVALQKI